MRKLKDRQLIIRTPMPASIGYRNNNMGNNLLNKMGMLVQRDVGHIPLIMFPSFQLNQCQTLINDISPLSNLSYALSLIRDGQLRQPLQQFQLSPDHEFLQP